MKKLIAIAVIIAACATLCAPVCPRASAGKEVPAAAVEMRITPVCADILQEQMKPAVQPETTAERMTGKEESPVAETCSVPVSIEAQESDCQPIKSDTEVLMPLTQSASAVSDPYHTDVYPENVYSEELIYDADGNLLGKTTTIPTEFGPDTIWIDGQAYYDLPGFGLVEWSGPSQRTEDYTMYENGNKVGIMGDEDESSANRSAFVSQHNDWPEPTGEVIDQTINTAAERNTTPPNYKPDLTPPDDPNARIID
jgi:hypothetical protein